MKDGKDFYLVRCGACSGMYNDFNEAYKVATEIVRRDSEIIGGPSEASISKMVLNFDRMCFEMLDNRVLKYGQ